ncbi:MAG: bifunctional riboflavin kinase/FAD synthetase [Actinobacteria bacterium]|nr:bifunctional riboflavin kinase/FAD synthetase [Actinomycetota bacterium]
MRVYRSIEEVGHRGDAPRSVAIGTFDGFHLGHRAIVTKAVQAARAMEGAACVLTFEPHPSAILDPENQPARLCTFDQKVSLLEEAGVDELVALPFDEAFAALGPAEFSELVLSERLNARQVLVGENFRFGHRGAGTAEDLLAFGRARGFSVTAIGLVIASGKPVSSTRIRALIAEGRVEDAATLLGRPHALDGIVEGGAGRGRDLGSPTANLDVPAGSAVPGAGVYVTRTTVAPGDVRPSVTSIGTNPTFETAQVVRIETFILHFAGDLYGRPQRLEFLAWIRAQRAFPDAAALRRRIAADVTAARDYFARSAADAGP